MRNINLTHSDVLLKTVYFPNSFTSCMWTVGILKNKILPTLMPKGNISPKDQMLARVWNKF